MTETGRAVWLVTAEGVYDHGCHYVAGSLEDAQAFCDKWSFDDDGYHAWRIDEMRVGELRPTRALTPQAEVVRDRERGTVDLVAWPDGARPCPRCGHPRHPFAACYEHVRGGLRCYCQEALGGHHAEPTTADQAPPWLTDRADPSTPPSTGSTP